MNPETGASVSLSTLPDIAGRDHFFMLAQDPMCVASTDGYFKRVNPAFTTTLGWAEAELLAGPYVDFVHPDDHAATLEEAARGTATSHFENRYKHRDGSWRWFSWHSTLMATEGLIYATARDITDQKQTEEALRRSEARFRALSEHGSDLVCILAPDGSALYGSPSYTHVLGAPIEELHRRAGSPLAVIHPDDQACVHAALVACVIERRPTATLTCRHWHANGSWRTLEAVITNRLDDPDIGGIVVTSRDITERAAAESALHQSEQRLRALISNAPLVLSALDDQGVFTFSAGRGLDSMGLPQHASVGRSAFELYHDNPILIAELRRALDGEDAFVSTTLRGVPFEVYYTPTRDSAGKINGLIAVALDLSARVRVEAERDRVFDLSRDLICVAGADGYFKRVNPAFTRVLGWAEAELLAQPFIDFIHPDDHAATVAETRSLMAGVPTHNLENRYRCVDGSYRWISWAIAPVNVEHQVYAVGRDITDRRTMEETLRMSEERFRGAFDGAAVGMAIIAPDGRYLQVNQALCQFLGYAAEELCATTWQAITIPDDVIRGEQETALVLAGEQDSWVAEKRYRRKDGQLVWGALSTALVRDAKGAPLYFISQVQDIMARKRVEEALRAETERRAAIIATQRDIARSELDIDTVMTLIAERAAFLTGAMGAVIELVEGEELVYRAVSGSAAPHLGLRVARSTSLSGLCVATGGLLRCDDAETDQRVDREACRRIGLRSMIVVPLLQEARTIGVLKVLSPQPNAFDDTAVETLQLISGLLAAAMDHALAFKAKQLLLAERTHMAHHDALTGLPNRTLFIDRLTTALAVSRRRRTNLAVCLLDLNGFKAINDTLGHAAGDELLCIVAERLRATVRESDTVARLGGDEFALILPETDENGALVTASKILEAVGYPIVLDGQPVSVGGSLGIALHPAHGADPAELLHCADVAMYQAKREQWGYSLYNPQSAEKISSRFAVASTS